MTTEVDTNETQSAEVEIPVETSPVLTADQEISTLRNVHEFLSRFDRVPGSLAHRYGQALDAIALVANSLIAKNTPATTETGQQQEETTNTVTQ